MLQILPQIIRPQEYTQFGVNVNINVGLQKEIHSWSLLLDITHQKNVQLWPHIIWIIWGPRGLGNWTVAHMAWLLIQPELVGFVYLKKKEESLDVDEGVNT